MEVGFRADAAPRPSLNVSCVKLLVLVDLSMLMRHQSPRPNSRAPRYRRVLADVAAVPGRRSAVGGVAEPGDVAHREQPAEGGVPVALVALPGQRRDVVRAHRAVEAGLVVGPHALEHVGRPFVVEYLNEPAGVPGHVLKCTKKILPCAPQRRMSAGRSSVIKVK